MTENRVIETRVNDSGTPLWVKRAVMTIGTVTALIGTPFALNLLCIVPLITFTSRGSTDTVVYGVVSLTFALVTAGAGFAAYRLIPCC